MKICFPGAKAALSLFLATALSVPLCAEPAGWDAADWDLEDSEFTPEDGWHFGKLDNGMRYIIRRNDRPENTALVRMLIKAGSIDERPEERGFAHYVEHMAFNGSTNVPEGEMIKLLEREGLAFGAETNASTGFRRTQYKLNLPRAKEDLLATALMLMRETASELTITEEAVDRERGVILSERRVRNSYSLKNTVDLLEFAYPGSLASQRLPIGTIETLSAANAAGLRHFWEREYVPADTIVMVVGDFDPAMVEAEIQKRFADWQPAASPDQPSAGPVDPDYRGQTDIYLDPALTETITLQRNTPYIDRPDTFEQRRTNFLVSVGADALRRRIQSIQRSEDPPFRAARFSASDFMEATHSVSLSVTTEEGGWKRGFDAAVDAFRRALIYGFTEAEIAEQVAQKRTAYENRAANAGTRSNGRFMGDAFGIAEGDYVTTDPQRSLARFETIAADITPENVLAALREKYFELEQPLIRFTGKTAPEGGAAALRQAVTDAYARELTPPKKTTVAQFAYTDFGPAGTVVSDTAIDDLGIRTLRFANGVMLNLKRTDLQDDRVNIRTYIDGGDMLRSKDDPLTVDLTALVTSGGLGKHSRDELQSILAGRSVSASLGSGSETFISRAATTPRDFKLQLQLLAAYITDPGYRPEGLGPWLKSLEDFYARLGKTPGSAYGEAARAILSDYDNRFIRHPIEDYRALDYAQLDKLISDRLAKGAIEIAIVGDFDEDEAIALVGETFGALPQREAGFRPYDDDRRDRSFTAHRGLHIVTHDGEPDQAMLRLVWPTTDDEDWELSSQLALLRRVVRLMLTEKLREELGQTYSPSVSSSQSGIYRDYGTFSMGASIDVGEVDAVKAAMIEVISDLQSAPPVQDVIQRARQPVLESIENRLKSNSGWMSLVGHAQSKPEDIERFQTAKARYENIGGADLQALAIRYLNPDEAVEFRVVPSEKPPTAQDDAVSDS